jgi:hypothetical protein
MICFVEYVERVGSEHVQQNRYCSNLKDYNWNTQRARGAETYNGKEQKRTSSLLRLENNLLHFHLVEEIVAFNGIGQRHHLIGHETIHQQHQRKRTWEKKTLKEIRRTQVDAASSATSLAPVGRLIGRGNGPFGCVDFYRTLRCLSMGSTILLA